MPGQSLTEKEFNDYVVTHKTKATELMTLFFADPENVMKDSQWPELQKANSLPMILDSRTELPRDEITMMLRWPSDQLEELRKHLVEAVNARRRVEFYSELSPIITAETIGYEGSNSSAGNLVVTFVSPSKYVVTSLSPGGEKLFSVLVNPR
jgi:hypothetical protein